VLAPGGQRARDDLVRGVIAAHGVDRDDGTGGAGAAARSGVRAAVPIVRPQIPGQRVTGVRGRG